jgi:hypothetical protein
MTIEIVLDTSVLLDLLSDSTIRRAFLAHTRQAGAVVIVPLERRSGFRSQESRSLT